MFFAFIPPHHMKSKKILGILILIGYLSSQILSMLGYVDRNIAEAKNSNRDTMTQLVAVMVEESIYDKLEKNLQRYTTSYIQKHYPHSKAIVLKINTKEYNAPELTKLLENLYFDGLKNQSSRLIGLVLF